MFFSWRTIVCERGARRDEEGKQREKRGIGTKVRIEKNARHATRNVHGSPRAAYLLASSYHCPGTGHSPDDYHTESLSYTTSSRNRKCRRAQTFISFVRVRDFADGISVSLFRSFIPFVCSLVSIGRASLATILKWEWTLTDPSSMAEAEDVAPWREIHADRSRWHRTSRTIAVEEYLRALYTKHF